MLVVAILVEGLDLATLAVVELAGFVVTRLPLIHIVQEIVLVVDLVVAFGVLACWQVFAVVEDEEEQHSILVLAD